MSAVDCKTVDTRILKSIYGDIDISTLDNQTITELLWNQLSKWKDATALECGLTGKKYTYNDCYNLSRGFATSLIKHGAKKQDICGFLVPNCPEINLAILGAWDSGCIVDVINHNFTKEEIIDRVTKLKTKHVVVHSTLIPLLENIKESGCSFQNIVVIGGDGSSNYHSFEEWSTEKEISTELLKGKDIDTGKCILILAKTSGTTGHPKTVAATHRNYIAALRQFTTEDILDFPSFEDGRIQPVVIGMLPLFQTFGLFITMVFSLHQGAKIVIIPQFEPKLYIKLLMLHKPTVLHLTSPLVDLLADSPDVTSEAFENCKSVFVGFRNFAVTEATVTRFQAKVGKPIVFQEGWGCTEALLACIRNPSFKNTKFGSVGRIAPSVLVKVIDIKTGDLLGPFERGELCVKGPQVSMGYYDNDEATQKLFDSQGFLHTGDFGYYDEDQCFYIIDRIVDLIKATHYVSPTALEYVLRTHPDVLDIVIVGVPDTYGGEVPQAHVVRKPGSQVTEKEIQEYLKARVPEDFNQLKGGVVFTDTIPRGATGKTLRRVLRHQDK